MFQCLEISIILTTRFEMILYHRTVALLRQTGKWLELATARVDRSSSYMNFIASVGLYYNTLLCNMQHLQFSNVS